MSTFKKNTLAIALVAAMGMAANASAYTVTTGAPGAFASPNASGDNNPEVIATVDASATIPMAQSLYVNVVPSDDIIGRTTGFFIRFNLTNGATWNDNPVLTVNPAMAGWTPTVTLRSGSQLIVSLVPPAGGFPGLPLGAILEMSSLDINDPQFALSASGGQVGVTTALVDPVGATTIAIANGNLLSAVEPRLFSCIVSGRTEPDERIDVGFIANPAAAGQGSRQGFSSDGSIGTLANNTTRNFMYHAGFLRSAINGAVVPGILPAFQYLATDDYQTVITLTDRSNLGAFSTAGEIFLATDGTCATPLPGQTFVVGTGANGFATNQVRIRYDVPTPPFTANGHDVAVCFNVGAGNSAQIDPTAITAATWHVRNGAAFPTTAVNAPGCNLEALKLNGSQVKVETFNQASNAVATGLIRVTNPSTTSGIVSIDAWDDAGVKRGPVIFTLAAGASAQFNATQLETGVAGLTGTLGAPTSGRWRFLVTGQFPSMRVVSFARNNSDNTLSNMTDYDTNDEQVSPTIFGFPANRGSDPQ